MTLDFQGVAISGIARDPALRARISKQMSAAVGPLQVRPISVHVAFVDDNGPKGGPAIRCALTVRLPYRPAVRVERVAETRRLAFDAGFPVLERQLERYRERDREGRRHPKKYFAARRVLGGEPASPPKRRRGAS